MANANFTPDIGPYTTLKPFRFWCQKVLPLVYDDSLSYYELLGKVVDYLNKTMEDVDTQITDIQGLLSAYEALQDWVNHYYDSADFAADIDAGLDRMAESGQLNTLLTPIVTDQLPALADTLIPESVFVMLPDVVQDQIPGTVATQLPAVVSNQIGGTVATQLPGVVSNQIGGTVANQLPAVVSNQIGPVVEDKIVDPVEDWLDANVSGGIAVDRTLSVLGAGADAAFTGARLETLDNVAGYEHIADTGFIITTANPYAFNYTIINDNDVFSDQGTHTYKMIVVPVNTGDKYSINAHKISVTETENHFAVTYAFCAKWIGDPETDIPYYLPTTYSRNNAENLIVTVPEINIPAGQAYDTTGYLVVITADIEDPVYKVVDEGLRKDVNDLKSDLTQTNERIDNVEDSVFTVTDGTLHTGYPIGTPGHAYTGTLNNAYVWVWVDNYVPMGAIPTIRAWSMYAGNVYVILFNKNSDGTFTPKYKNNFAIVTGATGSEISIPQTYFDDADTYLGFYSTENATGYNASGTGGVNTQRCTYTDVTIGTPIELSGSFPTFDQSITVTYQKITDKISDIDDKVEALEDELESVKKFVVVAKDGSGDYTSVKNAVYTESENTVIIVKPGVYTEETIDVRGKRIILIGTDRNQCIIQNPNGLYANPTFWVGCGYFENLTITAPYISGTSEEVGVSDMGAYAIHCDTTNYNIDKQLEFHHCTLQSDFFPAMGVGLRKGFTLIIDDCELINNQVSGRGDYSDEGTLGALYFHDADGTLGEQNIKVHDSVLKSNLQYAMTPYKAYGQAGVTVNCEFINNVLFSKTHGLTNNIWFRNDPFNPSTGNFKLVIGFGNSNDNINS